MPLQTLVLSARSGFSRVTNVDAQLATVGVIIKDMVGRTYWASRGSVEAGGHYKAFHTVRELSRFKVHHILITHFHQLSIDSLVKRT